LSYAAEKKLEVYELLSEQKTKQRQKRVQSRKKQKGEGEMEAEFEEDKGSMYELQVGPGEEKPLLVKIYNFYWAMGKIYLNNGRDIS
jgi:hypothetical protein